MVTKCRKLWAEDKVAVLAGSFALLSALLGLWMAIAIYWWPFPYNSPHHFYYDIDSPILATELARVRRDIIAIAQGPEAQAAIWWNTVFDCFLIPLYCSYLFWFAVSYSGRKRLCLLLTGAVGLLDATENFFMFQSLKGSVPLQYFPSVAKWLLLSVMTLYIARLLCGNNRGPYSTSTRRLLGLLFGLISILMFAGITARRYSWLALGTRLFLLTFVINAIGLVGPIFAIPRERRQPEISAPS